MAVTPSPYPCLSDLAVFYLDTFFFVERSLFYFEMQILIHTWSVSSTPITGGILSGCLLAIFLSVKTRSGKLTEILELLLELILADVSSLLDKHLESERLMVLESNTCTSYCCLGFTKKLKFWISLNKSINFKMSIYASFLSFQQ